MFKNGKLTSIGAISWNLHSQIL